MRRTKRALALVCVLMLAMMLAACGSGNIAPETYDLSAAEVKVDSFTKVVGERGYMNRNNTSDGGKIRSIVVNYTGVANAADDLKQYADYLITQGFVEYFGQGNTQMSMALRKGDGAALISAIIDGANLEMRATWQPVLDLTFGETQYVSGNSMAILQTPETVVFKYPTLAEDISTAASVDQLILDGVNHMIQYAKERAAGQNYKLMGNYAISSALSSACGITLTGELTMGDTTTTLTSTIAIADVVDGPTAQYSDITAQ